MVEDLEKTVIGVGVPEPVSSETIKFIAADGSAIELQGEMIVGRTEDCDLTINDGRVSRQHAKITVANGTVQLEDLQSANGTYINGERLDGSKALNNGDSISFDNNEYTLQVGDAAPVSESAGAVDTEATMVGAAPPPVPEPQDSAVPSSWDESQGVEGTQLLEVPDLPDVSEALQAAVSSANTDLPHLVIGTASGSQLVELPVSGADDASVWEIGRDQGCEVVVNDPSVSSRHAQLVYGKGRWRVVNMVSTNGIFVNGEKKLSAYLADGDEIQLGAVKIVFKAGAGGTSTTGAAVASGAASAAAESGGAGKKVAIIAVIAVVALAAAYFLLA